MAIQTNADLQSQIAAYLNRSNLTQQIPTFIQLCEARIYYGCKEKGLESAPLRIAPMEQAAHATFSEQKVALPADFLAKRVLLLYDGIQTGCDSPPGGVRELDYLTPVVFWRRYAHQTTGKPRNFTIGNGNIILGPIPDGSYTGEVLYYQTFPALTLPGDSNWILDNAPGAYLWGSLIEAYRYIRNMDQAAAAANTFSGIINALNDSDQADAFSGSAWQETPDMYAP